MVSTSKGMNRIRDLVMTDIVRDLKLSLFLVIFLSCLVQGKAWTRFRGPNGSGISEAKTVPVEWTSEDYNWKVKLPGGGHGSPVIWKDKLFITSEDTEPTGGMLLALNTSDGRLMWKKRYKLTAYRHHRDNSLATSTPVVDADLVFVLWQTSKEAIIAAGDHSGNEIWRRTFPGIYSRFGPGCSPMLFEDLVVFTHEHREGSHDLESVWIALDRKTGRDRWTRKRNNSQISYSTPCVYAPQGRKPQLIFSSRAHGITGIEPATGQVIWELPTVLPGRIVSSPILAEAGDIIIATCGKGGAGIQLTAARPGYRNKPQRAEVIYTRTGNYAPYVPTPLAKDGLLFIFNDSGEVSCMRLETGKPLWCEKPGGRFYGSPVWVNGSIYCINRAGEVLVIKAAPTYELVGIYPLGEKSHATPAVAGGKMYLRTYSHLISIGGKSK